VQQPAPPAKTNSSGPKSRRIFIWPNTRASISPPTHQCSRPKVSASSAPLRSSLFARNDLADRIDFHVNRCVRERPVTPADLIPQMAKNRDLQPTDTACGTCNQNRPLPDTSP